ncbi:MAG: mechanosensitive ion channel family protein [Kiritimatiellia bacterium]|jgi:MscS family membrane protein
MDFGWSSSLIIGNETWRIVSMFGVILLAAIGVKAGRIILATTALKLEGHERRVAASALRSIGRSLGLLVTALAIPAASAFLNMDPSIRSLVLTIAGVLMSVAVGFTLYQLVDVVYMWLKERTARTESKMDDMLVPIVQTTLRVTIIVLTLLQIAQSLTDKPLTSILAGLGVGGLAVALAAQDTIKHFFGSIVLFSDKPFQIGDRIVVDGTDGMVEEVGFRSTRIRTLEGALVTIPNGDLANKLITNWSKRPHIRYLTKLGITYDTPPEKVERAMAIIRELLDNHEGMSPDFPPRVEFSEYGSTQLTLLVLFWYHPADFWSYMKFTSNFHLKLLERFNAEGIDFAFPTQTLYLAGDAKRPLQPVVS